MTGRVPLGESVPRDAEERRARAAEVRVLVLGRLPAAVGEWPEPWRGAFEERAGIVEFMGGRSRAAAEIAAVAMVRAQLRAAASATADVDLEAVAVAGRPRGGPCR